MTEREKTLSCKILKPKISTGVRDSLKWTRSEVVENAWATSGKVKFKCRKIVLPGGLFISSPFEVGLIDTGGMFERGDLFSLANAMASVLHKKIECKVETLKYKRLKVMQPKIKTNPSFQVVNNSSWISPHEVLQSTVNTFYHFFIEE